MRVSEATAPCATLSGDGQLSCMADALEKPQALYSPFPFPDKNAIFTVTVDDTDRPAKFVSTAKWIAGWTARSKTQSKSQSNS